MPNLSLSFLEFQGCVPAQSLAELQIYESTFRTTLLGPHQVAYSASSDASMANIDNEHRQDSEVFATTGTLEQATPNEVDVETTTTSTGSAAEGEAESKDGKTAATANAKPVDQPKLVQLGAGTSQPKAFKASNATKKFLQKNAPAAGTPSVASAPKPGTPVCTYTDYFVNFFLTGFNSSNTAGHCSQLFSLTPRYDKTDSHTSSIQHDRTRLVTSSICHSYCWNLSARYSWCRSICSHLDRTTAHPASTKNHRRVERCWESRMGWPEVYRSWCFRCQST